MKLMMIVMPIILSCLMLFASDISVAEEPVVDRNEQAQLAPAEVKKVEGNDIIVVVNEKNPLKSLTLKQVKQIFLGRLRRFPDIDSDMSVADREDSSALHYRFYQTVVRMDPTRLKRYRARYLFSGQGRLPKIVTSEEAMKAFVKTSETAIGYIELAHGEAIPDGLKALYRFKLPPSD